jgi:hypothetical protein
MFSPFAQEFLTVVGDEGKKVGSSLNLCPSILHNKYLLFRRIIVIVTIVIMAIIVGWIDAPKPNKV